MSQDIAYATIPRLSLKKNFAWTLMGNVTYAGCQWGVLMVLAKLGSPEKVGQFALGLAITAPIIIFFELALRPVQATDAKKEYHFADYFRLRLIATVIAFFLILLIVFLSNYKLETKLVILSIGLAKSFEAISDIIFGLLQQHERMDRIAISMMVKGVLSLGALSLGLYITGSVFWGTTALALVWLLLLLTYDLASVRLVGKESEPVSSESPGGFWRYFGFAWDKTRLWRLAWLAAPLSFVSLLYSLKANIPRYFIEGFLGERELGIYAAMVYVMVAGNVVINALGESASPRLAKYYASGKKAKYGGLLLKLTVLGTLLGLLGVPVVTWFGPQILTLLYSAEFAQNAQVFTWIMIANAIGFASIFGCGLTAARYFRVQLLIIGTGVLLLTISSYLLIPKYGLLGAAWALVLVHFADLIFKSIAITHVLIKN